jgi:hypothetical protein
LDGNPVSASTISSIPSSFVVVEDDGDNDDDDDDDDDPTISRTSRANRANVLGGNTLSILISDLTTNAFLRFFSFYVTNKM